MFKKIRNKCAFITLKISSLSKPKTSLSQIFIHKNRKRAKKIIVNCGYVLTKFDNENFTCTQKKKSQKIELIVIRQRGLI